MRLIDADEVKRFYEEDFPTIDNGVHWSRNDIIMNLSNIPTVKAIPIEWLQQMIEEDKTSGHIDEYGEYQEGTTLGESCEHVLANWYNTYKWKWEKENENK